MARTQILPLAAAVAAAMGMAACSNTHDTAVAGNAGNGRLCIPFATAAAAPAAPAPAAPPTTAPPYGAPATAPPATAGDPAALVEDCLHRWGYTLAASRDDANQVATATVAACGPSLARWNQQAVSQDGGGPVEAPSLLTGQPTTPLTEHYIFAQGRALFYVVQARAGKCTAPPIQNGVPVGVAAD
ncbi:MAG TPA: hypothetical protein VIE16_02825 [Phenylobacterium sp.]|jgi:hypothetical protein